MSGLPTVAGLAEHRGWAIAVCVAARDGMPVVVDRRQVALVGDGVPSQPYHHEGQELPLAEAEALVARVEQSVRAHARAALEAIRKDIAPDHRLVGIALREGPDRPLPRTVAEVLRSQKTAIDADGALYTDGLCAAATALDVHVTLHPRGPDDAGVARFLREVGRALGPPWHKDHRSAAARAIGALPKHAKLKHFTR